jgi:hypothetical protein
MNKKQDMDSTVPNRRGVTPPRTPRGDLAVTYSSLFKFVDDIVVFNR